LLDLIYKRIQKLSEQTNNFGLFSLTLDTHHPNGYISASCKNKKYLDGKNPILNSLHCIDYLIGKFMDEFLNSDLYKDTTL
ncbi:MAG: phosphoglycerol transferase I, partial [Candidatus Neomarinimicrobiota bacterium]